MLFHQLPFLEHIPSRSETDESCKKQMERLLNIWKERSLYRADYIQQLKLAIEDNNSPIQRGSATENDWYTMNVKFLSNRFFKNVVASLFITEMFLCLLCRGEDPCEKKLSKGPGGWGGRRWWLQKPHIPSQYRVLCNSTGKMSPLVSGTGWYIPQTPY